MEEEVDSRLHVEGEGHGYPFDSRVVSSIVKSGTRRAKRDERVATTTTDTKPTFLCRIRARLIGHISHGPGHLTQPTTEALIPWI